MKQKYIVKKCKYHGETDYVLEPSRNSYRCKKCRIEAVCKRRNNVKFKLVKEFDSKCKICNYDKYIGALEFHHLDPSKKSFSLSNSGTKNYETMLNEAKKCILVCANCHRELEAGLIKYSL